MNFPLITWQVAAPQFFIDNEGSPIPFGGTTLWGFGLAYVAGMEPDVDTLAGEIVTALQGVGCSVYSTSYQIINGTSPSLSPLLVTYSFGTNGNNITLDFGTDANAAVYGFDNSIVFIPSGDPVELSTVYNPAGMWAPSGVSGDVSRTTRQRAASSSSDMSGLTTDIVNWGNVADIEVRSTLFPVANAFVWYATQQIYATKAQRDVNDPNNILEVMLKAAATGVVFRIYEQGATVAGYTVTRYQIANMPGISAKSAATDFITADDAPRLWTLAGMFFRGIGP